MKNFKGITLGLLSAVASVFLYFMNVHTEYTNLLNDVETIKKNLDDLGERQKKIAEEVIKIIETGILNRKDRE